MKAISYSSQHIHLKLRDKYKFLQKQWVKITLLNSTSKINTHTHTHTHKPRILFLISECFISQMFSKSTLSAYRLKELLPNLVICPLLTGPQIISKYRLLVVQCTWSFMHDNNTWRHQCSRDQHFFYHYRGVIHAK